MRPTRCILAGIGLAFIALGMNGGLVGAAPTILAKTSPFVGTYTWSEQFGSFHSTGTLQVDLNGSCSDGSTLDQCGWTSSHHVITITSGNDSGEVIHWIGKHTHYGIASKRRPGTAQLYINGQLAQTGTFYAQRTS
jgi:hypothetical protein